jgi:hypothetical protein
MNMIAQVHILLKVKCVTLHSTTLNTVIILNYPPPPPPARFLATTNHLINRNMAHSLSPVSLSQHYGNYCHKNVITMSDSCSLNTDCYAATRQRIVLTHSM